MTDAWIPFRGNDWCTQRYRKSRRSSTNRHRLYTVLIPFGPWNLDSWTLPHALLRRMPGFFLPATGDHPGLAVRPWLAGGGVPEQIRDLAGAGILPFADDRAGLRAGLA